MLFSDQALTMPIDTASATMFTENFYFIYGQGFQIDFQAIARFRVR